MKNTYTQPGISPTWLNTAPSFSRAKILSVFVDMATMPSGHCSDEKPAAYSRLSYDNGVKWNLFW